MFSGTVHKFRGKKVRKQYPANRAPYSSRVIYPWRRRATRMLIGLAFWVHNRLDMVQQADGASLAEAGIRPDSVFDFVQRCYPETIQDYHEFMKSPMRGETVMSRIYMWRLVNKGKGKGCAKQISGEHPFQWATAQEKNAELEWLRRHS